MRGQIGAEVVGHTASRSLGIESRPEEVRRLVVLVPDGEGRDLPLARQIWELASPAGLSVHYLSLTSDAARELTLKRRLLTLCAVTRDVRVPVSYQIRSGRDWRAGIRDVRQPGDVVVCHAEQRAGRGSLSSVLEAERPGRVYVLSGLVTPNPGPGIGLRAAGWIVPIAILVGFFWLQVQIDSLAVRGLRTVLLAGSVLAEVALLWIWHEWATWTSTRR